ncbi:DUF4232 domain-containing protein [Streptomyces sp. NPDC020801]|uniref:DUF4232 domain-containing protein n=1 Tax=unclassified Streptomyces TaxID=2593676 RepID=UPI003792E64B
MQYGIGIRKAALATAVLSAALAVTGCQPGQDGTGAGQSSGTPATAGSASSAGAPGSASSAPSGGHGTSAPSGGHGTTAPAGSTPAGSAAPSPSLKTCAATGLKVDAYQAAHRPEGTGTGAAIVGFTNVSGQPCILRGHPSVAGAANGSPQHNAPLTVTPTGSASPVRVAPGGKAWLKLTFVQVQGEGDGYCVSGAQPVVYPTLVIGLPGAGKHQVALSDGEFAECDNKVTATAVSAAKPS